MARKTNPHIVKLARALTTVRAASDVELHLATLSVLLAIADRPYCSLTDVADATGLAASRATRHVQSLADGRPGQPGLGWVRVDVDPEERRRRRLSLTPAGVKILRKLIDAIR